MNRSAHHYMSRALRLATRGLWSTDPNPRVGCVLVNGGRVVGEGWHQHAGGPHAEINALAEAGEAARGATAYVTLEPCCNHGKTGPCTAALIDAGVSRVVSAMIDPNPLVTGEGLAVLARAGIKTETGLLEEAARGLNPGFCRRMVDGVPYVRAKLAMSMDGRTAMSSGESQWITSADSRRDVQRLRARSSAILSSVATVIADDPSFTVRATELGMASATQLRQPLRVIVDSNGRTPLNARLLTLPGRTLIATRAAPTTVRDALRCAGAEVIQIESGGPRVDLRELLERLAELQVNELLLECGPTLAGAMLENGCIDELVIFMAPRVLGDDARGLFSLPGLNRLADSVQLDIQDVRAVGQDLRITARVAS